MKRIFAFCRTNALPASRVSSLPHDRSTANSHTALQITDVSKKSTN